MWMAFDRSDGQGWIALTLASQELAVQFNDAFETAKRILHATDDG